MSTSPHPPTPAQILAFWFPEDPNRANAMWWGKDPALDAEIRQAHGATLAAARAGELDAWAETAKGRLALIIVLDQLSRNIHRGDPETYAADPKAKALTLEGLERGHDRELLPARRLFFYLPLEHSEELADQERSVALFRALASEVAAEPGVSEARIEQFRTYLDFAVRHLEIIARFGRFPHRNALLGRTSSPEELAFLEQPGSSF
jgi:uncharacterized protein (DUF924 family)